MTDLATRWPDYPLHESMPEAFRKFPDLPPEIRREIWRHSLPGPRVIHIMGSPRANGGQCLVDTIDNPLLLRICQESRTIACERYRLSFKPHLRLPIYFDFSSDTLLMQNQRVLSLFFERSKGSITSEVTMVKVIAVDLPYPAQIFSQHVVSHFLYITGVSSGMINAATRFGNLREIILLLPGRPEPDLEIGLCSDEFRAKMRKSYSESQDPYALKRREFLKDEEGSIPTTTIMTTVDFWNRFP